MIIKCTNKSQNVCLQCYYCVPAKQNVILNSDDVVKSRHDGPPRQCVGPGAKNFEWGLMTSPRKIFMSFYHTL